MKLFALALSVLALSACQSTPSGKPSPAGAAKQAARAKAIADTRAYLDQQLAH